MGEPRLRAARLMTTATMLSAGALAGVALPTVTPAEASGTGRAYAAIGFANGGATLLVGHLGERAHEIVQGSDPAAIEMPAVAPGGNRIAYVAYDSYGARLAVVNYDGTHLRYLTGHVYDRDISQPVWSADSTKLFIGMRKNSSSSFFRAYVVPLSSGGATAINNGADAAPETARPNGREIAFNTMRTGDRWMRTGVMSVTGSGRHDAGPTNLWNASWRPGTAVVAVSRVLRDDTDAVTIQIQLLNTATGRYHALAATQSASTYGAAYPLAWSKDGSHLFYLHFDYRNGHQADPRVYRIRADGTGRTDVTPSIPTWVGGQIALQGR